MEGGQKNIREIHPKKNGRKDEKFFYRKKSAPLSISEWKGLIQKKGDELIKDFLVFKSLLKEIEKLEAQKTSLKANLKLSKPHITNLTVSKKELTVQLSDGRELSIPIEWFAKWGVEGVKAEKLRKYEIWEGEEIYFPEIDEVLGIEKFIKGLDAPCE